MTKKSKEFQNLSLEEINSRINELRKELMKENVHISSGTAPANPGRLKQIKKNIACLKTIISQKQRSSSGHSVSEDLKIAKQSQSK